MTSAEQSTLEPLEQSSSVPLEQSSWTASASSASLESIEVTKGGSEEHMDVLVFIEVSIDRPMIVGGLGVCVS